MLVMPGSLVTNMAPPMLSSMMTFIPASKLEIQPLLMSPIVEGSISLAPAGASKPMVSQLSNSNSGNDGYNKGLFPLPKEAPKGCW